ncbi:MAG: adenosine deaminase [Acidimicrobiia bacterium]|nr:adenosine deaminase [Acidimicrobiia bacterium]
MLLPSVLLHDHLDGGLRPQTVLELARKHGYEYLPAPDLAGLEAWFDQSESGSLERYLEAFDHTIAVMQTYDAIERVAYEAVIDLSGDGVVYAELRFCPAQHTSMGLRPIEVIEAVSAGMKRGAVETGLEWGLIIDSLRHLHRADDLAKLAVSARHLRVVGFDIAGPEAGFPPRDHRAGFNYASRNGLGITIHAGEAGGRRGVANMASAVDDCHAQRIGHGVEIINDCEVDSGEIVALGPVARRIRDRFIPLEMCPASNMATSRLEPDAHPFGPLFRAGFNVTLSTDNRLMSHTSMSREYEFAIKHARLTEADLIEVARRSLAASFTTSELRAQIWAEGIAPGFRAAGLPVRSDWVR